MSRLPYCLSVFLFLYCSLFLHSIGNFHVFFSFYFVSIIYVTAFFSTGSNVFCFFFCVCFVQCVFLLFRVWCVFVFIEKKFFLHGKSLFFSSHIHNHFSSRHWKMTKKKKNKNQQAKLRWKVFPFHYIIFIWYLFSFSLCIVCYFLSTPFSLDIDDDNDKRWRWLWWWWWCGGGRFDFVCMRSYVLFLTSNGQHI